MPVSAVPREARNFQAEYDPGTAQANLRHQPLKAGAIGRRRTRLSEVVVNDRDLFDGPAQGYRPLAERVLSLGAFGVLEYLPQRGLPDVQVSVAPQMTGGNFLWTKF
jgi:hypothetical protein